ncbi:/ / hypothetical protein / 330085:331377 Reverse [Candidatus Hepatoplasma crinochetorum]|uniref:Uncharacterized protein n=1 Tax=Candidatus Hepatoplasma crinochetorum TaxID=295596 RepID=A0A0G7ZMP3_9MOLU|nr:/ / hypothetical protein / 330085:331377 Reverse [Candidatus Hepatoplasma crinochetorum]
MNNISVKEKTNIEKTEKNSINNSWKKFKNFWKSKSGTFLILLLTWFGIFYFLILGKYTNHYFGEAFLCTNLEWFSIVCLVFVSILFFLIILWLIDTWKNNDGNKRKSILITYGAIYVATFVLLSLQVLLAITFANTLFKNTIDPNADFAIFLQLFQNEGAKVAVNYLLILDNLDIFNNLFSSLWIISIIIILLFGLLFYYRKLKIKNEIKYKYTVNATLILAFISMTFSFQGLQGLGTFGLNSANIKFIDIPGLQDQINNNIPGPFTVNFTDAIAPKSKWLGANNNIPSYLLLLVWVFVFLLTFYYWVYNVFYKNLEDQNKINKRINFVFNLFIVLILANLILFYSLDKFIIYPISRNQIEANGGPISVTRENFVINIQIDNRGINPGLYNSGIPILLSNDYKTNSYYLSMFILNPATILFIWLTFRFYYKKNQKN